MSAEPLTATHPALADLLHSVAMTVQAETGQAVMVAAAVADGAAVQFYSLGRVSPVQALALARQLLEGVVAGAARHPCPACTSALLQAEAALGVMRSGPITARDLAVRAPAGRA